MFNGPLRPGYDRTLRMLVGHHLCIRPLLSRGAHRRCTQLKPQLVNGSTDMRTFCAASVKFDRLEFGDLDPELVAFVNNQAGSTRSWQDAEYIRRIL